jgi:hypothetical protein
MRKVLAAAFSGASDAPFKPVLPPRRAMMSPDSKMPGLASVSATASASGPGPPGCGLGHGPGGTVTAHSAHTGQARNGAGGGSSD